MANVKNLITPEELNSRRTPEQHSADSVKGGKASGEARRLKAAVKRALRGKIPESMGELRDLLSAEGIELTNDNGIALAMVIRALSGDKAAADWVRDTAGEKPKDEVDLGGGVVILAGSDQIAD